MAIAKGWKALVLPALLVGIWGYGIGTYLGGGGGESPEIHSLKEEIMIELPEAYTIGRQLQGTIREKRMVACDTGRSDRKWVFHGPSREGFQTQVVDKKRFGAFCRQTGSGRKTSGSSSVRTPLRLSILHPHRNDSPY